MRPSCVGRFSHVVVSGTVTTIASVINPTGAGLAGTPTAPALHWIYVGKNLMPGETVADFNAKTCSEVNVDLPHSAYDIQSVDLGGVISKAGDYGVLFNDPSVNNNWRGKLNGGAVSYELAKAYMVAAGALGTRGYLLVEGATPALTATNLEGYALVFDYKTGSAWGYKADELQTDHSNATNGDIRVHVMPPKEAISRLMVTPNDHTTAVATNPMRPGQANFGTLSADLTSNMTIGGQAKAIVDRDENAISGNAASAVTCVGTVDVLDLVSPGAAQFAPDGGWMTVQVTEAAPALGAVVYQLDFGGQGATAGTLNGVSYPGTWNNVFQVQ